MILSKIKYSKIAVVIFLTVLIWVWADLALDETLPEKSAVVVVDESVDPKLWIRFGQSSSADVRITISGPHTAVTNLDRELRKGLKTLEFVFNAVQEDMDKPGTHSLKLLDFLRKDRELRRRGLKVETCDPNELTVNVEELVKKTLTVECVDESGNNLKSNSIEPSKIDAFVRENSRLTAKVELTKTEIQQARETPIKKYPRYELESDYIRESTTAVIVKLAPEVDPLKIQRIEDVTIGIDMSPTLWAQYYPVITNMDELLGNPINVRATDEAKQVYENQQRPHMTLFIFESDIKQGQEDYHKAVHYNFPEKYIRTGEIELNQEPAMADFKLIPLPSAKSQ